MITSTLPKVSIIIPVYNGGKYMCEAINSAIGQTYPNVEVIVVNDGSRDDGETEKIALSYGDRVKYFYKNNGGVATALNLGIEKMTGEYFSWLSHDDVYHLDKIEKQIKFLNNLNDPKTIIYGGYELINEKSNFIAVVDPSKIHSEEKLNINLFPLFRGLVNGCTLLIHKSYFESVGLFNPMLPTTQDYDLFYKIFRNGKIRFLGGQYVRTRVHEEQGSKKVASHVEECNKLWIEMMNNVSIDEMIEMEGSEYLFFIRTEKFLEANTPYKDACQYAKQRKQEIAMKIENSLEDIKVSVIIPFFNRIPYLLEAIESVLNQTHKNLEIILVDDGSTDDIEGVRKVSAKDARIKYANQENKGVSVARNLGIGIATGEYIAFLDSDDLFLPNKIATQLREMLYNGYKFSHTSYNRINNKGHILDVINVGTFAGKVFPRIMSSCGIATPTVMLKSEIAKEHLFNIEIGIGEDVCLWIDLSYKYTLGGIVEAYTSVRVGESTAALNIDKQRIGFLNILNHIFNNKEYLRYNNEIQLLLIDFSNLFKEGDSKNCEMPKPNILENNIRICTNCVLELQKSKSWRLTEPLRAFKRLLVKVKNKIIRK